MYNNGMLTEFNLVLFKCTKHTVLYISYQNKHTPQYDFSQCTNVWYCISHIKLRDNYVCQRYVTKHLTAFNNNTVLVLLKCLPVICDRSMVSCELESLSCEVYSIQHYAIKFVSDLWKINDFLRVFRGFLKQ
jgi:hypothetical protein